MLIIRPEIADDHAAIRHVNQAAFGGSSEATLVETLRQVAHPHVALVAVHDEQVVGHIFFSPVTIESPHASFTAMGLAPLAVLPEYQKQGIGSQLVREGLQQCRRLGQHIVVVLGHADYYPRFGFTPAKQKGLQCEYDVPNEVFMVAELEPNVLQGRRGLVKYHLAFKNV